MGNVIEKADYSLRIAAQYNDNKGDLNNQSPGVLNAPRNKAFARFVGKGLPTFKTEDYKYSNLQPVFATDYNFMPTKRGSFITDEIKSLIPKIGAELFFLKNGFYQPQNSAVGLPEGVLAGSLKEVAEKNPPLLDGLYDQLAGDSDDALVALNTAWVTDGFFVLVAKNRQVAKPIQVVNVAGGEADIFYTQRNFVKVEAGASLTLVVCDVAMDNNRCFSNQATEIFVGENASVEVVFYRNQPDEVAAINSVFVRQEKNSTVKIHAGNLQSGFLRNNITIGLEGENCETGLYGVAFTNRKQHIDNFIRIDHSQPHCNSFQLFKNVLADQSSGAFAGRIHVKRDAQKTNAFQRNNNLLLTDQAKMFTKPQLIIDADDVKCSHGATIGQLDEEALFYLRSRGIPEKEARLMLTHAFTFEVLQEIKSDLIRESLYGLIEKRLAGIS